MSPSAKGVDATLSIEIDGKSFVFGIVTTAIKLSTERPPDDLLPARMAITCPQHIQVNGMIVTHMEVDDVRALPDFFDPDDFPMTEIHEDDQ